MIVAGRELDDGSLSWDDLYAFIFAAPPGTAIFHAVEKGWTTTDYLLAHVIDGVAVNNWQRTDGARKRPPRNVPKPFPRPSDKAKDAGSVGDTAHVGGDAVSVISVEEYVARRAEREQRWRDKQKRKREGGGS